MELNKEILNAFEIKPKSMKKIKGIYIVTAFDKTYKIRTVKINNSLIKETQKIIKYLDKHNLKTTDKYKNTIDNEPFFYYKGEIYVVSDYVPLKTTDFTKRTNLLNTSIFLAKFHNAVENTDINLYQNKSLIDIFKGNLQELNSIKKRILKQNSFKEFDLLFLKSSPIYLEEMKKTIAELETDYFKSKLIDSKNNLSISHNNIKEDNFGIFNDEIYINNFTKISVNSQLLDVASLIQRYLKTSNSSDIVFYDIINEYVKYNALNTEDIKLVKALSLYPTRYVKTVLSFYTKNMLFTPTGHVLKLEEERKKLDKLKNFYI